MDELVKIVIDAFPWLVGVVDVARVVVSALPRLVTGLPTWLYGVLGMVWLGLTYVFVTKGGEF